MKTRLEHIEDIVGQFGQEAAAGRVAASTHTDADAIARETEWLDDPDPLSIDWRWLSNEETSTAAGDTGDLPSATEKLCRFREEEYGDSDDSSRWVRAIPTHRRWRAMSIMGAVAASLVVGALVGQIQLTNRSFPTRQEVVVAEVFETSAGSRGDDDLVTIGIRSPRDGFATIVRFVPGQEPGRTLVDPEYYEASDFHVSKSRLCEYGPLAISEDSVVLLFVTKPPAADVIRRFVTNQKTLPSEPQAMIDLVRERLWESGYDWMAIGVVDHVPK